MSISLTKNINEEMGVSEDMSPIETMSEETSAPAIKKTPKPNKPAKKKFNADDLIECISIFPGEYFVKGERSGDLYTFASADDVLEMRYDDLDFLVKRKRACVFAPRFIIQDKEFLALHPEVEKRYGKMFSAADLRAILRLPANQIAGQIKTLPIGAKESLKTIAATQIDKGRLTDIKVIKVLDAIYGTNMLSRAVGSF